MRGADASGDLLAVTLTTFPPLLDVREVSSACWLQAGARNGAMRGLLGSCTFLLHREQCSCSRCRRRALCIAPALYFRDEPLLTAQQSSLLSVLTLLLAQAGLHSYLSRAPTPSKPALSCFGRAARTARTCMEPLPVQGDFLNAHFPSLRVSQGL